MSTPTPPLPPPPGTVGLPPGWEIHTRWIRQDLGGGVSQYSVLVEVVATSGAHWVQHVMHIE